MKRKAPPGEVRRLCVQWPRLGPLHINRLLAAHAVLESHGVELIALETASQSSTYQWRLEQGEFPFPRTTVFVGQNYDDIRPRPMHAAVWAKLEEVQPDAVLIHSYSTPDARAALAWTRTNRRTAILMAESTATDAARGPIRERLKRLIVSQFDSALTSGSRSTAYATSLGMPADVIFRGYSVVDNEYFASRAAHFAHDPSLVAHLPGLADPGRFFLASARFMKRKNLAVLLRAYHQYRHRAGADAWRLILLGDGEGRRDLQSLARDLELEGLVFPGWRQIEDLPAYFGLASAFVHTASVDQWGLVINEAMAAGLPVVVSRGTGCSPDLVEHGRNGYVFEPDDVQELARLMHRVAHEDDRAALSRRSREIIDSWPLSLFGTGLRAAANAGVARSNRGLDPRVSALIKLSAAIARSPRSFHSVQD